MMVLFQNKIIYMPNIPPFSRSETVEAYERLCAPVRWKEESTVAEDNTRLALVVGEIPSEDTANVTKDSERLVVLYFQGNASSMPPRLPYLSSTIKEAHRNHSNVSIVAASYRGYWKSAGKPTAKGIARDASAALRWTLQRYAHGNERAKIVLWGQSIGAGVATNLVAEFLESQHPSDNTEAVIHGIVMETPFTSLKDLLVAFYPQRWLPYRYLTPFLRSNWDSVQALERIGRVGRRSQGRLPRILMLEAERDEVVPAGQAAKLEGVCKEHGLDVERTVISGALHTEVVAKSEGRREIARFLKTI
ncbi:hypothetical protein VTN49DRAFT_4659 [Thermomyces lanuginosus]|uniref:uncharacterized protein n=1 Tax=Thermomyces lanuginosus TaxID=5541 RepID=UPI0037437026